MDHAVMKTLGMPCSASLLVLGVYIPRSMSVSWSPCCESSLNLLSLFSVEFPNPLVKSYFGLPVFVVFRFTALFYRPRET